jgi:hypothetical protein
MRQLSHKVLSNEITMPLNDWDEDKDKFRVYRISLASWPQIMSRKKVRKERKLLERLIKVKNAGWLSMHVCTLKSSLIKSGRR